MEAGTPSERVAATRRRLGTDRRSSLSPPTWPKLLPRSSRAVPAGKGSPPRRSARCERPPRRVRPARRAAAFRPPSGRPVASDLSRGRLPVKPDGEPRLLPGASRPPSSTAFGASSNSARGGGEGSAGNRPEATSANLRSRSSAIRDSHRSRSRDRLCPSRRTVRSPGSGSRRASRGRPRPR